MIRVLHGLFLVWLAGLPVFFFYFRSIAKRRLKSRYTPAQIELGLFVCSLTWPSFIGYYLINRFVLMLAHLHARYIIHKFRSILDEMEVKKK